MKMTRGWMWVGLVSLSVGCGASGLQYHVDDSVVENVPAPEKQQVLAAKEVSGAAEKEVTVAVSNVSSVEGALKEARNEQDKADRAAKAAAAKVNWLEAQLDLAKHQRELSTQKVLVTQSNYELEKARLISSKGIKPTPDFDVAKFQTAAAKQQKKYGELGAEGTKLKEEVEDRKKDFDSAR